MTIIGTLTGSSDGSDIASTWRALDDRAEAFVQTFAWASGLLACIPAMRPDIDLLWYTVTADGAPGLVAPLALEHRTAAAGVPVRALCTVRYADIHFADGVAAPSIDWRGAAAALLEARLPDGRTWHLLECTRLRATSPLLRLASAIPGATCVVEPDGGVVMVDTTGTYDDWEQRLPASWRQDVRRARRRAASIPGMRLCEITSPEGLPAAFDAFVVLEAQGWKRGQGALDGAPFERGMLRHLVSALAPTGRAGLLQLHVGDVLAGAQLWVRVGSTVFGLKTAYREELAVLAPGKLLWLALLERCCADPAIARLDAVGVSRWIQALGGRVEPTYAVTAANTRTVLGRIAQLRRRLRRRPAAAGA